MPESDATESERTESAATLKERSFLNHASASALAQMVGMIREQWPAPEQRIEAFGKWVLQHGSMLLCPSTIGGMSGAGTPAAAAEDLLRRLPDDASTATSYLGALFNMLDGADDDFSNQLHLTMLTSALQRS